MTLREERLAIPLVVTGAEGTNGDGDSALLAFDDNGKPLGPFTRDPRIADPRGLAVDHKGGLLFINSATDRVLAIDRNGVVARDSGPMNGLNPDGLDFPILSDLGNATATAFGLRFALPDYLVDLYRSLKNDLAAFNGDACWTLSMAGRFVVGQDGVIHYAEVNPDYTRRPEPSGHAGSPAHSSGPCRIAARRR